MRYFCAKIVVIIVILLWDMILASAVRAQEFPYVAPAAPEFDGRGSLVRDGSKPGKYVQPNSPSRIPQQNSLRMEAPSMPGSSNSSQNTASRPVIAPPVPGYRGYQEASPRPPRQASSPQVLDHQRPMTGSSSSRPPAIQSQPQQRQDCSQFPMIIARSRSEAEMQVTARRYLTCLMQNGWNMDQARQQVISTIESTYRLAR